MDEMVERDESCVISVRGREGERKSGGKEREKEDRIEYQESTGKRGERRGRRKR